MKPGKTTTPTRYSPVGGRGPREGVEEEEEMDNTVVEGRSVVDVIAERSEDVLVVFAVLEVFDVLEVLDSM